jgi:hypothetical protein
MKTYLLFNEVCILYESKIWRNRLGSASNTFLVPDLAPGDFQLFRPVKKYGSCRIFVIYYERFENFVCSWTHIARTTMEEMYEL